MRLSLPVLRTIERRRDIVATDGYLRYLRRTFSPALSTVKTSLPFHQTYLSVVLSQFHLVIVHQYVSSRIQRRLAQCHFDRASWVLETNVDVISALAVSYSRKR